MITPRGYIVALVLFLLIAGGLLSLAGISLDDQVRLCNDC